VTTDSSLTLKGRTMNGFDAYLAAQNRTANAANSALPDSPVVPDRPKRDPRLRISLAIRRLADRIDPMPVPTPPHTPGMAGNGR
jgi:hypothetical protein